MGRKLDSTLAVLNGLVGDYLARTQNGLATELGCYRDGSRVELSPVGLARACPELRPRVVVLVHGVMCTETIWQPVSGSALGSDYGALLERELGITPLYVRYNTGLPIADNGAALAQRLEALVGAHPGLEELLLIGYSMGGLVVRSACHHGGMLDQRWLPKVRRAFYLGTPHLGAPAERVGKLVARVLNAIDDPYTRLVADLGNLRSAGVKDLGHADLRSEDRAARGERVSLRDERHPVPLLPSIRHYLIAGTLAQDPHLALWFGDALVPLASATSGSVRAAAEVALPPSHVKILSGVGHLMLAHHPDVYAQLKTWCEE